MCFFLSVDEIISDKLQGQELCNCGYLVPKIHENSIDRLKYQRTSWVRRNYNALYR